MESPSQNSGVGNLSLLQGISPTEGLNPSLPHCRPILHQLSHKGHPRILEWIAYPFSRLSSQPRNQTLVSCIAGGFFANCAIKEASFVRGLQIWRRKRQPTPVFLPRKSHGRRNLVQATIHGVAKSWA